jgi:hypothetical protein
VRVIQRRYGACLALEPFGELLLGNLDGDGAIQPSVTGLVHFAHAARANRRKNLVGPPNELRRPETCVQQFYFTKTCESPREGLRLENAVPFGDPAKRRHVNRWEPDLLIPD